MTRLVPSLQLLQSLVSFSWVLSVLHHLHSLSFRMQLGVTGVLLFLKITRYLRVRRDNKRFREWNSLENTKAHPRNRHFVGRRSMKNAFDIVEDDEGIPA